MYVCICQQITDTQIREFCQGRSVSMSEVRAELGLASDCGRCGKFAKQIMAEVAQQVDTSSIAYAA